MQCNNLIMVRKRILLQRAIDDLSSAWLGKAGVLAIYEEVRNGETVIVVLIKQRPRSTKLPSTCHGYRVVVEHGNEFIAEVTAGAK
jgi:hypothetical protein